MNMEKIYITPIENKLSKRMTAVCDMVTQGRRVADIGCDHAFVSIYLVKSGRASYAAALDVREGPLKIAKQNISAYNMNGLVEVKLSDGFSALKPGETDSAILAGMGGALIIRLLDNASDIICEGYELVLQPQSETGRVRRYLRENGYEILKETMILDEGKFYTIIKAIKLGHTNYKHGYIDDENVKIYDEYGEYLIKSKDDIFCKYLSHEHDKYISIIETLEKSGSDGAITRLAEIRDKLDMIDTVIKMTNNERRNV